MNLAEVNSENASPQPVQRCRGSLGIIPSEKYAPPTVHGSPLVTCAELVRFCWDLLGGQCNPSEECQFFSLDDPCS